VVFSGGVSQFADFASLNDDVALDDLEFDLLTGPFDAERGVYLWRENAAPDERLTQVTRDYVDPATGQSYSFDFKPSYDADISGNGEWVAFVSHLDVDGTETGPDDPDIFIRTALGDDPPVRISKTPNGTEAVATQGDLKQATPVVSDDGRFVAFVSNATLLDDTSNDTPSVFLYDRDADQDEMFDEAGGTSMTRITAARLEAIYSVALDDDGLAVSVTQRTEQGTDEWAVYRRDTQASSFDERAPRVRSLSNALDSTTDLSNDGRTALVRDGQQMYVVNVPPSEVVFPELEPSQAWPDRVFRPVVQDPVNTATGALVAAVTDVAAPNGAPMLSLNRNYNSQRGGGGALGDGWRSNWDTSIVDFADPVFVDDHGGRYTFVGDGSGGYVRPSEILADLERDGVGWVLRWFDGATWRYDDQGRLASKTDWNGTSVTVTRDVLGLISSVAASTGDTIEFTYTSDTPAGPRLAAVTASDGRAANYDYTNGLLTDAANPDGAARYEYDDNSRIVAETDATDVAVHSTVYDDQGRVAQQTLATGEQTTFIYDVDNRTTTVTDVTSGDTVTYAFDEAGRLLSITDPAGNTTTTAWNVDGLAEGSTDRLGHSPTATYDANGNLTTVTDPVRGTTSYVYDGSNRVISVTEPTGAVTTMTYGGNERLPSTVTDALGGTTTFDVVDGLVVSTTDADGITTTYNYDNNRRMTSMTNGLGNTWTYGYDAVGRRTTETTPLGHATSRTFDDAGRVLTTTAADGGTTTYTYDPDGRVLTTTDPIGAVTTNTYDPDTGLLATTTDPAGRVTSYAYNALGELTSTTANDGGVTETDYGTLGRVTATRDPLGRETTYAYDANGNRTDVVAPDGGATRTEYDTSGRIAALEDPLGRRTTNSYDEFGRLTAVTHPDGTTTSYSYDLLDRQTVINAPDGGTTTTSFTPAGRTDTLTDPEGGVTSYGYDAAGQAATITDPNGNTTSYTYDPDGRQTSVR
ncbi:MAG: DUF6531 domain-containing protein, partial [Actinomycetota bacterium]